MVDKPYFFHSQSDRAAPPKSFFSRYTFDSLVQSSPAFAYLWPVEFVEMWFLYDPNTCPLQRSAYSVLMLHLLVLVLTNRKEKLLKILRKIAKMHGTDLRYTFIGLIQQNFRHSFNGYGKRYDGMLAAVCAVIVRSSGAQGAKHCITGFTKKKFLIDVNRTFWYNLEK